MNEKALRVNTENDLKDYKNPHKSCTTLSYDHLPHKQKHFAKGMGNLFHLFSLLIYPLNVDEYVDEGNHSHQTINPNLESPTTINIHKIAKIKRNASLSSQKIQMKQAAKKRLMLLDKLANSVHSENTDLESNPSKPYVS